MCVRIHYNIDLDFLKNKHKCNKIVNNEKLKKGIINKKNYLPIIFESNESLGEKENNLQKKNKIIQVCLWGINPFNYGKFQKDVALINARLETLHLKKSFNILINKNRCAIVVNGYFEWKNDDISSKKLPYYIFKDKYNHNFNKENSSIPQKNEELECKANEEISNEQDVKDKFIKDEINIKEENSHLVQATSLKRKNVIKEEIETKKIKIESSNEECEENDSYIILAGLYSISDDDKKEYRNTIITTSSENTNLKNIHERCPLLLSRDSLPLWLNVENSYTDIINKIKEEHAHACNNLKYIEVKNWGDYSNYSKQEKKDSILKYMKK